MTSGMFASLATANESVSIFHVLHQFVHCTFRERNIFFFLTLPQSCISYSCKVVWIYLYDDSVVGSSLPIVHCWEYVQVDDSLTCSFPSFSSTFSFSFFFFFLCRFALAFESFFFLPIKNKKKTLHQSVPGLSVQSTIRPDT